MFTTSQLVRFAMLHPQLERYFMGVYALNQLPQSIRHRQRRGRRRIPLGLIVNSDTANLPGQHWIACIVLPDGHGEVFDSFGQLPPPRVQLWMNRHCVRGWIYNANFIQGPLTTLCGGYCLFYLYQRLVKGLAMQTIVNRLTHGSADSIIRHFLRSHRLAI